MRNTAFRVFFLIAFLGVGAAISWLRTPANVETAPTSLLAKASPPPEPKADEPAHQASAMVPISNRKPNVLPNYSEVVAEAAKRALAGDGRAALLVVDGLVRCLPIKVQFGNKPDPRAAFESELESYRDPPQWLIDRKRSEFASCSGFLNTDPFAGLPERPKGYESIRFWNDLAYQENDPVAVVQHAAAQNGIMTGTADTSTLQATQAEINKSAMTGDPEALFKIGSLIADGRVGQDTLSGYAAMIAACNMGYDCTTSNEFAYGACSAANTCPQGEIYTDKMRNTIGDTNYAKAYRLAQQLQDALARGDTNTILQFVRLKGALSIASR